MVDKKKNTQKPVASKEVATSKPVKPKTVTVVGKTFVAKTRIRRLPKPVHTTVEQ